MFWNILEGMASPIWLLDKEGNVTYVNPSFEEIIGYKKEDVVGNSLEEFCQKITRKEDVAIVVKRVMGQLKSGEVTRNVPITLITKEGRELSILYHASPIRDSEGRITGEVVSGTDVTELRKHEEELKKSQEYTRSLFYSIPIPIPIPTSIFDLDGKEDRYSKGN